MINKLLQKQIHKHLNSDYGNDTSLKLFIEAINNTYDHIEKDRQLIERSMEISSNELTAANKKLRCESEENRIALLKLQESLQLLQQDYSELNRKENKDLNIIDIANIIKLETEKRKYAELKLKDNLNNLEKINKELDQFAYIVSHDLKAPLRAIASLSDWIKEDTLELLSEESKKNLELLRGRVIRMENLINGILAYTKAGKNTTEKKIVNLNDMLNDIIDLLNPPKNIKITQPKDLPSFETEATKLQQVFANLLNNSIKYMDKPKGEINIGWIRLEDKFQFFIEDNGPGIESKYHEKIFVIFQTLSTRDQIESTGIGLSIVKKLIEEQGGKIWIESIPNKGTKFLFTWPSNMNISKKQNI